MDHNLNLLNNLHVFVPGVTRDIGVLQCCPVGDQGLNEVFETTVWLVWIDAVSHVDNFKRFHFLKHFNELFHTVNAKVVAGSLKLRKIQIVVLDERFNNLFGGLESQTTSVHFEHL